MKSRTRPKCTTSRTTGPIDPMGSDLDFPIGGGSLAESLGNALENRDQTPDARGVASTRSVRGSPEVEGGLTAITRKARDLDAANLAQPLRSGRGVTMPSKTASVLPMLCAAVLGLVLIAAATSRVSTAGVDVVTYHNDVARTGQNLNEIDPLAGAREQRRGFGKLGLYATDGKVDAQPLYLSSAADPGGRRAQRALRGNRARQRLCVRRRHRRRCSGRFRCSAAGETPSDERSCGQVVPEIGITVDAGDRSSRGPNGVIYVVAMSKNGVGATSSACTRSTSRPAPSCSAARGRFRPRSRAPAPAVPAASTRSIPKQYEERSALLLAERTADHGVDVALRHRSVHRLDHGVRPGDAGADERAQRHAQRIARRVLDGRRGSGGRPARQHLSARRQRHVRHHARRRRAFPTTRNFGNAFLKIVDRRRPGGGGLLRDVRHRGAESNADADLGSGGALVFPDFTDAAGT